MSKIIIGSEYPNKVIPLIDQARKSINIVIFDWRWYSCDPGNPTQRFNQAIVNAIRRGVEVRGVANMKDIAEVMNKLGAKIRNLNTRRLVHTKLMIIDKEHVIIGSHNFTQSAFTLNFEVSILLNDLNIINDLQEYFNNLYNHG
jgi:phosphatidylserine/phosphatidylglycerophosphate/cardiolipin synthase-like enzyme